jgi:hypothetical protein
MDTFERKYSKVKKVLQQTKQEQSISCYYKFKGFKNITTMLRKRMLPLKS